VAFVFLFVLLAVGMTESQGPGLYETVLIADQTEIAGTVRVWNSPLSLTVQVELGNGNWLISEAQVFAGLDPVPTAPSGNPIPGAFPYKSVFSNPGTSFKLVMTLVEDLGLVPGDFPVVNVAVHCDLVELNDLGEIVREAGAWAYGPYLFEGSQWGWWFEFQLAHPQR
jgi:hypothetical protein